MRRLRLLQATVLAALALWPAARLRAQYMTHEWVISAGGGLSDPTGVFEEQMQMGPHGTLSFGHHFGPSWFVGLRGGYFPFDAEPAWAQSSGQERIRFWNLDLDSRLMLYPESWFTPYLALGAGASLETQTYADSLGGYTVDMVRPGVAGGVGISVHREASTLSLFTELVYHHFPSENGSRQFVRWTSGLRISLGGRPF
jgi:hypothetical protein